MDDTNRPFKWGSHDRREYLVQNSEVAYRMINDTAGNPVYIGRAKHGTLESESKWQIRKVTYDSNDNPISVTWPLNSDSLPSRSYDFQWAASAAVSITAISQANPAVVSAANSFSNGDKVILQGINGMTELNFDGDSNIYTVANASASDFELSGVDSSAYTAYSSGGTATNANVVNLSYQ